MVLNVPFITTYFIKVKKAEDRERLADKEDSEHIQRILDIVEDVREEVAAVHSK